MADAPRAGGEALEEELPVVRGQGRLTNRHVDACILARR